MSRLYGCILVVFAMLFGVSSASGEGPEKPARSRAVEGVLSGENGEQVKFSIPEGQGVTIRNREDNTEYRLVAKRLGRNGAVLDVVDPTSGNLLERFDLGVNEKALHGTVSPFSLSLTGVVEKTTPTCRTPKSAQVGEVGGPVTESTCCITCGGWIVCCTPSSGWCCELECIAESQLEAAVGDSCSACTN